MFYTISLMNFSTLCLWSLKWSHLLPDIEKQHILLTQHPHTDDGFIHIVGGVIYDEQWRIYLHHDAKANEFLLPWGKLEQGETFEQALKRELQEELSIDVQEDDMIFLSSVKYMWWWIRRCFHMYEITKYSWSPVNNEHKKYDQYRAQKRESNNALWFSIAIQGTITDDVEDIMHSFIDFYHLFYIRQHIDTALLQQGIFASYDASTIDSSDHYYLFFNAEEKQYFFEDSSRYKKITLLNNIPLNTL